MILSGHEIKQQVAAKNIVIDPFDMKLETWPEWEGAEITHWMPLPEPPEEKDEM